MITAANFKELRDEGFTVVPGALTPADCDRYRVMYDQWLSQFPQGQWPKSNRGLIRGYNTGHLDPTWRIRLQVKGVFSQVWKTEKLMTSFDSIAIGRPPEDDEEPFDDGETYWLHLDQEASRDGLHAYQGGVYLEDACEDDWTLQVMTKSHHIFHKFFAQHQKAKEISIEKQFFRLSKPQIRYFEQNGCKIKRVAVPKGGLVLWDSRLVHANAQPKKGRDNPGRWRYVVFVSMTPAHWASDDDLAKKAEAYAGSKMTNHWSSEGTMLMRESAESKSHPKKLPDIALTTEVQLLAGVIPYDFDDGKSNGPPKPITYRVQDKHLRGACF